MQKEQRYISPNYLFSIIPESPYKEYTSGRVYQRPDLGNRKYIELYGQNNKNFGTAYARYLMTVNLGHKIHPDFEVDHINNDCTDDRIDNFQVITPQQNQKKRNAFVGEYRAVLLCPVCQKKFTLAMHNTHFNNIGRLVSFCSQRCSGKFNGSNLTRKDAKYIGQNQVLYAIRTHWFEYEDYFHAYYPYTEIIQFMGRELLSSDSSRCKDIPGLTEFCWDIFTPDDERKSRIIELAEAKLSMREIAKRVNMDRKLVTNLLKEVRPDLVQTPNTEELLPIVKKLIEEGRHDEDIAVEVGLNKQQLYDFIRYHKLVEGERKTLSQKNFEAKILRIIEYTKLGLSGVEMARRENTTPNNIQYFKTKWEHIIKKDLLIH